MSGAVPETVTLWRPTGPVERDLVAASGWREWPPRLPDQPFFYPVLNRWYATKITREWNVPVDGVGYVTAFDVRREFLDRYTVQQVGGQDVREYWIPAEELPEFNANIVGAIREVAAYRGPIADASVTGLPEPWLRYLRGESWFHRGWLPSGAYVWLYPPDDAADLLTAWDGSATHPGIALIGGDGSRENLALDLRQDPAPVMLVDITSAGWADAIRQADDVATLIERIESGRFTFRSG